MGQKESVSRSLAPAGVLTGGSLAPDGESITIDSGDGAYVTTESGERFIDYKLGSGPMIVGHAHPRVVDAIRDQASRGTTFYGPNTQATKLAERVVEAVPCADGVQFVSTGTEATYQALRTARAHTGRTDVLKFEGAYHGWHDIGLVSSNHSGDRLFETSPPDGTADTAGMTPGARESTVTAPWNDLGRTTEIVEAHAEDLAAIILEPVMRVLPPREGFLEGVRELCDEHGIVLVFDEVVTGFRLAWGGAQEYFGVEADLATYGKPVGGGTPLAALCGREEVMAVMEPGRSPEADGVQTRGTLNGNPLSAAAGIATLDVLNSEGTYRDLNGYGDRLRTLFAEVLADAGIDGQPVGEGAIVDYVVTDEEVVDGRDLQSCDAEPKRAIDEELFREGILKSIGGKMYLSTRHGDEEFQRTAEAFKAAVERADV